MAAYEYYFNELYEKNHRQEGIKSHFSRDAISETGALPCFCKTQEKNGADADKIYTGTKFGLEYSEPLCED